MVELKNNIKRFRFERDQITQKDLADALEVSRQTINSIETGKFNPSITLVLKMAVFFGCSCNDLFYLKIGEEKC